MRLVVVVGGALLVWLSVIRLSDLWLGPEMSLATHVTNAVGVFVLAVPLVLVARRYLDRRPVATLGFTPERPAWRTALDGVYGAATWLAPAMLGLIVSVSFGWLEIRLESTVLDLIGVILLLIVLVFVYEAFPEELIFRGYVYRNLTAVMAPWIAVIGQAVLFAVWGTALWVINNGWGVLAERSIVFFTMGIVIGCIRLISGSLWATMGFHVAFQVVMQLVLSAHYIDVEVSDEDVFALATAVVAFCTATAIAGVLWRGEHNWTSPERDGARIGDLARGG